jgi:hypothetical protein
MKGVKNFGKHWCIAYLLRWGSSKKANSSHGTRGPKEKASKKYSRLSNCLGNFIHESIFSILFPLLFPSTHVSPHSSRPPPICMFATSHLEQRTYQGNSFPWSRPEVQLWCADQIKLLMLVSLPSKKRDDVDNVEKENIKRKKMDE